MFRRVISGRVALDLSSACALRRHKWLTLIVAEDHRGSSGLGYMSIERASSCRSTSCVVLSILIYACGTLATAPASRALRTALTSVPGTVAFQN